MLTVRDVIYTIGSTAILHYIHISKHHLQWRNVFNLTDLRHTGILLDINNQLINKSQPCVETHYSHTHGMSNPKHDLAVSVGSEHPAARACGEKRP